MAFAVVVLVLHEKNEPRSLPANREGQGSIGGVKGRAAMGDWKFKELFEEENKTVNSLFCLPVENCGGRTGKCRWERMTLGCVD